MTDNSDVGIRRTESDSMGTIEVPAEHLWGAQTQRSLAYFSIGEDRLASRFYHAYGYVKKAAALVNEAAGTLPPSKSVAIQRAADELIAGELDAEFPVSVWQTGSGTQSNMNVNEVLANRAIQILGGVLGSKDPVHPNDDVNLSQSSNDTFPTAMHIAAVMKVDEQLLPSLRALTSAVREKAEAWRDVVKIGRTHLQDAVPLTVGQEWSGYAAQLDDALSRIEGSRENLLELAAGGTAVGTGLNAPVGFGEKIAAQIAQLTGVPFRTAPNKFAALASVDAMAVAMSALKGLAIALMKISNDIRWLASGPRCGLGELKLPANEPGSSIMPGKVNPTQCEAMMMVCIQVFGEEAAVSLAASMGNLELNVMRPLVAHNFLHSATILGNACDHLRQFCIEGIELDSDRIAEHLNRSLMLVTALSPLLGYEAASAIAHKAFKEGTTLREAAISSGKITPERFDELVVPGHMVGRERGRT